MSCEFVEQYVIVSKAFFTTQFPFYGLAKVSKHKHRTI